MLQTLTALADTAKQNERKYTPSAHAFPGIIVPFTFLD